jgi:hypothetical protein
MEGLACNKPEEIQWKEKRFKERPGMITELIKVKLVTFITLRIIGFVLVF